MLRINIENSYERWTKITKINMINVSKIHEHIFALHSADEFVAYEYQNDLMLNLFAINEVFFTELVLYLIRNNLSFLLELQILLENVSESMFEFVLN